MRKVDLRALVMPTTVRNEVFKLLATIEVAETAQAVRVSSNRAEGFVLGLETAQGFTNELIESLYIGFETATEIRWDVVRKT